jgi:uridylate kinase
LESDAPKYDRVLVKLSGESFKGERGYGIDPTAVAYMAGQINSIHKLGVEVGVVVGGGNIWRGAEAEAEGMERAMADNAGMLATVINALALQDALERRHGVDTRTQSAINVQQVAEPFIRRRAIRHLEKGRVVIFAAGTGNPYMTTDTAAALRSVEIEASILLMAKHQVDGIYSADPRIHPDATKYDVLTYDEILGQRLEVMDATALTLCMDNDIPILVFDLFDEGSLGQIVRGEKVGSVVRSAV